MLPTLLSVLLAAQSGLVDQSPDHVLDSGNWFAGSLVGDQMQFSGDYAFVAAPQLYAFGSGIGKIDVWKRSTTGYALHQSILPDPDIPTPGTFSLRFGTDIVASEEFLAVRSSGGTPGDFATTDLVHIYDLDDNGRASLQQTIQAPNSTQSLEHGQFGFSSDFFEDVMVVGQPVGGGIVHVFHRSGSA